MSMRHHKLNYVVVGLFVIAMIGVAFGSVFTISGQSRATDTYHLVMKNVADVKFGTQIRYEGYPIGQVERITPFIDGGGMRFRLDLSIEQGWRIPVDSLARVGSSSLLAAKTIDIRAGTQAAALDAGSEIPSAPSSDVFQAVANLAEDLGSLNRESIRPLIDDIAAMTKRLGGKLEKDLVQLTGSLNSIASSVDGRSNEILDRVQSLTRRLDDSSANLLRILSRQNADTVDGLLANAGETARNFAVLSRDLQSAGQGVHAVIAEIKAVVDGNRENVDKTLSNAQYSLQSISRNIDSIMLNVDATSRNMSEFSRLIRQNPSRLLGGSPSEPVSPASARFRGIDQ